MVKPPLRTKSIGFKVSEEEYAQLETAAQAERTDARRMVPRGDPAGRVGPSETLVLAAGRLLRRPGQEAAAPRRGFRWSTNASHRSLAYAKCAERPSFLAGSPVFWGSGDESSFRAKTLPSAARIFSSLPFSSSVATPRHCESTNIAA